MELEKLKGRKGFYFTLDALLASIILVGGLIALSQLTVEEQPSTTIDFLSKDLLTSLSELQVKEVNNPVIKDMIANGDIENVNNSLLEQLGEFWSQGQQVLADNFTRALAENLIPGRLGASIAIEGDQFFNQTLNRSQASLVSSRRMITGVKKGAALQGSTASAYLKKIRKKQTASFLYFGGFTGQGNISGYVRDIPSDVNPSQGDIQEFVLEGDFGSAFDVYINSDFCGNFTPSSDPMEAESWNLMACNSSLNSGDNLVELRFDSFENAYVGGGFVKVGYLTEVPREDVQSGDDTYWFSGIDGVINLYDGVEIPGILDSMEIYLHYKADPSVTIPIFLDIGNTTVYQANLTGDVTQTITNLTLGNLLDYAFLSEKTVPLRFGFYEGNNTNVTGNVSDVFLLTSRTGTMGEADIQGTNMTRLEAAKNVSHVFVDLVLNSTGNRVGLASYWASTNTDHALSTDTGSLHTTITGYDVQNPAQAQRWLCQSINSAQAELVAAGSGRSRNVVLMTDGNATKCCSGGQCTLEKARQDAINAACDDYAVNDVKVYTVGFGAGADAELLSEIANCTEALFRESTNFSGLQDIYEEFAAEIAASSIVFEFQRASSAQDVESELYTDSYILLNYTPTTSQAGANEISVVFQTDQFDTCSPTINIYPEMRVLDARVTSYSGPHWTDLVSANSNASFNLSEHSLNYSNLGDPFTVMIPGSQMQGGNNQIALRTGDNYQNSTGCSDNNTLIYTAAVNLSTGRSEVVEEAEGCNWNVEFETGNTAEFAVPSSYNGSNSCTYNSTAITYNLNDAYDVAIYDMLSKLDFDGDGRVFVDFSENDIEIDVVLLGQVPYLWGPSIAEVQAWE